MIKTKDAKDMVIDEVEEVVKTGVIAVNIILAFKIQSGRNVFDEHSK